MLGSIFHMCRSKKQEARSHRPQSTKLMSDVRRKQSDVTAHNSHFTLHKSLDTSKKPEVTSQEAWSQEYEVRS